MDLHTIHNKDQEKILRTTCAPFDFSKHTKKEIREMVTEMRKKMHEWRGVGLASTQIGINETFFVAQTQNGKFYAIFNPKITKTEGTPVYMEEGCLSVPGVYGQVPRYENLTIEGFDQNNKKVKIKAWGLLAQIFQHETDHLKGVLCVDKMKDQYSVPSSERLQEKLVNQRPVSPLVSKKQKPTNGLTS
jgi:peptide deformylase